ncbi:hypothetical protein HHFLNI_HHFLNI_09360, partial [Dysosmobacter welbionis]
LSQRKPAHRRGAAADDPADGAAGLCHRTGSLQAAAQRAPDERHDLRHRRQLSAAESGHLYHRRTAADVPQPARPVQSDHHCRHLHQNGDGDYAIPGGGAGSGADPAHQP